MDCLFCKIIAGEIPNYTVYQDENVLAFLDIFPCAKGHTVVIPKKHFGSVADIDGRSWATLSAGLLQAAKRVEEIIKPDGLNIGLNDRPPAGQAVPHLHWHIIPRWKEDGGGSVHSIVKNKEGAEVKAVAKLFQ